MWDQRYAEPGWAYGTEPNGFLADIARETEREVVEGRYHTGRGLVTQVRAFRDGTRASR